MFSGNIFKPMFSNAVDGVLLLDIETIKVSQTNKIFCDMLGYDENEILNLTITDVHFEKDIPYAYKIFNSLATGECSYFADVPFKRKDNQLIYLDINSLIIHLDKKNYLILILKNVTYRKQIQEDISFKTTLLETQLESMIDGILVVDSNGKTILFNKSFSDLWEIPEEILDTKDDSRMIQCVSSQLKNPEIFTNRIKYLYKNPGEKSRDVIEFKDGRVFERYSAPLIGKSGQYFGRIWYFRDISNRKKAEEALRKNEETFRLITEATNDAIWDWNLKTNKVYRNPRYAEMLGYKNEEVDESVEEWKGRVHPDDMPRIMKIANEHFQGKRGSIEFELRLKHKSGKYIWILSRGKVVERDEQGNPVRLVGTNIDITSRKEIEERLLRLNKAVEQSTEGIAITDLEPKILYANKAWADMHGYTLEEAIGIKVDDLQTNQHEETYKQAVSHMLSHDGWIGETSHKRKDGSTFPIEMSVSMICNEAGEPTGFISVSRDITELKKTEQALKESELRYRTLVENAKVDIGSIDINGRILLINNKAAERFGKKPEDVIGKTIWDLFPNEFADPFYKTILDVIESNQGINLELTPEIQGAKGIHDTSIEPLRLPESPVSSVLIISHEITESKKLENALIESEERYRALVEGAGETIAVLNKEGVFQFMNTTAAKRLGGIPEDFIGKSMWDVFPKEIADRQAGSIRKVIETGKGETFVSQTALNGNTYWYETTIEPLRNNEKQVYAGLIIGRDITKIKKAQDDLEIYREEVSHSERLASLGTLSATAAHELTQPLTVIRLLIENAMSKLNETSSSEVVLDKLKESLTEITNITAVVDRLRTFARKSTERNLKDVNLKTIAQRIVNLLKESTLLPKIEMIIRNMDQLPTIYSNEKDIEQLFFALLDNAVQAAGDKKDRKIIVSGEEFDNHIEIRFADNCGGIPPENMEKIFEPFFTTKPANQGTGLGLCIVRDIVLRTGGKIRVESELDEGTTFFVTFPIN